MSRWAVCWISDGKRGRTAALSRLIPPLTTLTLVAALSTGCSAGSQITARDVSSKPDPDEQGLMSSVRSPIQFEGPEWNSPEMAALTFTELFTVGDDDLVAVADTAAAPTDPNWVVVSNDGTTVTSVLTVPDASNRWTVLQAGDGSLAAGAGGRVAFGAEPTAAYGFLITGSDGERQRMDLKSVSRGSYESSNPLQRPLVAAFYDQQNRLVGLLAIAP